jgi:hypothetical protein
MMMDTSSIDAYLINLRSYKVCAVFVIATKRCVCSTTWLGADKAASDSGTRIVR